MPSRVVVLEAASIPVHPRGARWAEAAIRSRTVVHQSSPGSEGRHSSRRMAGWAYIAVEAGSSSPAGPQEEVPVD